ncbi:hypothetical protein [Enterobacter sp. R4-368]|uniref:hypothetical protein n=1 Tax=Enterobacter sp. R4-368 TaxID=1166130 RepID=UPI00034F1996|nr:hypothetical protein [Enterobacter sp. R4-368]AGN88115.1 hypothetical protein H650_24200 [Enterobacter sp. R4-368]
MTAYSNSDAAKDLRSALDKAPAGAVNGEWVFITEQAGVASQTGGYRYADGSHITAGDHAFQKVQKVVEKLEASRIQPFNKVIVRWSKSKIPLMRGRVTVDIIFDEAIVPRGPQSPVYEAAAVARRAFWKKYGEVSDGFIAERGDANIHNQTKWFGPHRRVLSTKSSSKLTLATDGLSTPWAGVAAAENGVECELFMELDVSDITGHQRDDWAHLLMSLGDLVANGYAIAADVEKYEAILFCSLTDDYQPMTRIVLSRDGRRIEGLPFGSVPLIRVTPITEAEIEHQDQSDEWASNAAKHALAQRRIET